jgi:hypothetical protein
MVYQSITPEPNSAMQQFTSSLKMVVGSYLWKKK